MTNHTENDARILAMTDDNPRYAIDCDECGDDVDPMECDSCWVKRDAYRETAGCDEYHRRKDDGLL